MQRCSWVDLSSQIYIDYHDNEWGRPVHDDQRLFEFLMLESFQAGLSWLTVLKKREAFRRVFDNFTPAKIAQYTEHKVNNLLQDSTIIRSKQKISATIKNAQIFLKIQNEYGCFNDYIWHFTAGRTMYYNIFPLPSKNELSDIISKDLKKRGMKYVGSTIIYSYLQAIGIINDHEPNCCFRKINPPHKIKDNK